MAIIGKRELNAVKGAFSVEVKLLPKNIKINALVDTGATFSKMPSEILKRLGVKAELKTKVKLGDGRIIEREVGYVKMELNGKIALVPVIFGKKKEKSLIGATTLEILGLVPDPIKKTVFPQN